MRRLIVVLALPLFLSCQDVGTDPVVVPNAAVADGSTGGPNPHFFWRHPQWTNLDSYPGTANPHMSPEIVVYRCNGIGCTEEVARFKRSDGTMVAHADHYSAVWNTLTANPSLDEMFRAVVFLGGAEVGSRDLKFVTKSVFGQTPVNNFAWGAVHFDPNDVGSNRPSGKYTFRFRLEEGALRFALGLGGECTDCTEASIPANATQTIVVETPSDEAAAVFETGSLSRDINVLIEKLDISPCLPTDLQQYPACFRFVAEPDDDFLKPVTVEVCLEQIDNFAQGQVQLYRVEEDKVGEAYVPTGEVEPLPNAPATNITCGEPTVISALARKHPQLARGLRSITRPLAKLFGARAAYAEDEGMGGRAGEFSRIGWARAVNVTKGTGDTQTRPAGSTLDPVVVNLTPVHFDDHGTGAPPARGVPVTYQLIAPGDVAGPVLPGGTSDDNGRVTITGVQLGTAPGTYRLVVTAPGVNLGDRNPETGALVPRAVPRAVFTATATADRVLLYHSDLPEFVAQFETRLVATGKFTADQIDVLAMAETVPPLATFQQYACVYAWTDDTPANPAGAGDRLKEYVDAGGKTILAVYAYSSPTSPWELQGGIMGPGYSPLTLTSTPITETAHSLNFETAITEHSILEGVTSFSYFTNSNYIQVGVDPGALLVARDNHGVPLIAVNARGNVVGINVWPGYPFHGATASQAHIDRAFANACR